MEGTLVHLQPLVLALDHGTWRQQGEGTDAAFPRGEIMRVALHTSSASWHMCATVRARTEACVFPLAFVGEIAGARRHLVDVARASNSMLSGKAAEDAGEALELRLDPPGTALMVQRVQVAGREFCMVMPQNVDAVMDCYIQQGQADRDPYWARLWPAGVGLADVILRRPQLVAGASVCEIGAGLGLPSIAAALSGARSVVLTDREPMALTCALLSARACGLPTGDLPCHVDGDLEALWPAQPASVNPRLFRGAPPPCTVTASTLDWADAGSGPRYDVVLACDVLYESGNAQPVAHVARQVLRDNGGRLLLADPQARTPYNREEFISIIQSAQEGPRILEEAWEEDVRMEGLTTRCNFIIARSAMGGDTVGVKLRRD